ncbi:MAG: nucleotidyltransferase domain-containing protein [bacterium]|nr:nucleotidyltransferase domain-containing protein [bacterium]
MRGVIEKRLHAVEEEYQVTILYACESGSRAWGFASQDSDYDVRFLYAHSTDWYLSIYPQRDVIEDINDGVLDINGWDLRKALQLLQKSNAPLREWLHSPVVYCILDDVMPPLRELAQQSFMPESLCRHYLSMARKSFNTVQQQQDAKIKTYLYTLRSLLCCRWIVTHRSQPPMRFDELLAEFLPNRDEKIRNYLETLLIAKTEGHEATCVEKQDFFEHYLQEQLNETESAIPKNPDKLPLGIFDRTFRVILQHIKPGETHYV